MLVFDINVSHGSVATRLRCVGMWHNDFIANLRLSLSVKEFWKSINIWRSYRRKYSGMFFYSQCICNDKLSVETKIWSLISRRFQISIQRQIDMHNDIPNFLNNSVRPMHSGRLVTAVVSGRSAGRCCTDCDVPWQASRDHSIIIHWRWRRFLRHLRAQAGP